MRVTFIKDSDRRYTVAVEREREPKLLPRHGPGNDAHLPHDLAHLLVEIAFEIRLGVFGQLAAGAMGIFAPASRPNPRRAKRSDQRVGGIGRSDMDRSEKLTYLCASEWRRRVGLIASLPPGADPSRATADEIERAVESLDREARRWHRLPIGGSVEYEWPSRLTLDPAGTHRGRRVRKVATARR